MDHVGGRDSENSIKWGGIPKRREKLFVKGGRMQNLWKGNDIVSKPFWLLSKLLSKNLIY